MADLPQNQSATGADGDIQLYHPSVYGRLYSIDQKRRIEIWLSAVPDRDELRDPAWSADMDFNLYEDWLAWAGNTARSCLQTLDKLERQFRKAALAYHKVPYQIRHSAVLPSGAKVNPFTLSMLSQIFESDKPRSRLMFFKPFYIVKTAALDVLGELRRLESLPSTTTDQLRVSERKCEKILDSLSKHIFELAKSLRWLQGIVNEITGRANTGGNADLARKHSREGNLFRLWMLTLPEVEFGVEDIKSTFVNWYAERLLEYGVEQDTYWSKMEELE